MKNIVTLAFILFISLAGFSQDRNITLKYNSDSLVYARNNVYFLNKEKQPFTGLVTYLDRNTGQLDQEKRFTNGLLKSVTQYHAEGWKKFTYIYYPNTKQIRKNQTYYNEDGTVNRFYKYNMKGENLE